MTDPDPGDDQAGAPPPGWQPPPPAASSYQGGASAPGGSTPPPPPGAPYGSQSYPTQPYRTQGYPTQPYPAQGYPTQAYPTQPYPPQAGPAYGAPPPGSWAPPPAMLRAAHKPGAMPLRPLGLGDIYDAAFRIIRFNPKATVGSAALMASVSMAVPIIITAVLTATLNLSLDASTTDFEQSSVVGLVASFGSLGVGLLLVGFGTILVTGMIAHVAAAAAVGKRLTLGEAWGATHGKRWRLIGLAFLIPLLALVVIAIYAGLFVGVVLLAQDSVVTIVVFAVISAPVFFAFLLWFGVRLFYLPVPALMLEPVGIFGALRRAFVLTRRQFWRTLGIALLTAIVVGIASQVIGLPVGLIGQVAAVAVGDRYTVLTLVVTQALTQVVTVSFATPFSSAVTSLQYLDQRMRKEAYDVELMQQAGLAQ